MEFISNIDPAYVCMVIMLYCIYAAVKARI